MTRSSLAALALGLAACAPASAARPPAVPASAARVAFDELEQRLVAARAVRVRARLRSEGLVTSSLEASLLVAGEKAQLEIEGEIEGKPVKARLACVGARCAGTGEKPFAFVTPKALAEGLLIGLTRMGLLHNAAQLAEGEAPEGTDGGARGWLAVDAFRGAPPGPIAFALSVRGGSRADVALTLDGVTRLPRERRMTVHFKKGEMRVTESYEAFTLDDAGAGEL